MSTEDQARCLMMRHSHMVKNRQQTMLARSAEEVSLDEADSCKIQGKMRSSDVRNSCDCMDN